ncbi:MAG: hypothetical protein JWO59_420, partial [Chloroflexi bacterium]|nr:hypothetical protein [Chloroflexota bacterium]
IWYAYLEHAVPSPWWNNQTYVDTLDAGAIRHFIEVTHERYADAVGDHFGGTIPAIFTDEPQFVHKRMPQHAADRSDLFLPWTTNFLETFLATHGYDLADTLPEVFWELPEGQASQTRYHFHDHVAERFAEAFADQLGGWCQAHGLRLTGHMMEEPTLFSQTQALGEAMRSLRAFQLPGIDMLCDEHEYTTAKQAQSVANQYGRPGVMSELYGVTNWDFNFVGHKAQGDWQAALGVTVRVPHLAWVSMAGEAKRDYPASIAHQSPWHLEYPLVENHFARLNTVLTRGRPRVRVGVLHPIESYWLCFGPLDQTSVERAEREIQFAELTRWLLFGLIDFDFIAESLLPDLCPIDHITEPRLPVGEMGYDVVLVPGMRTIRSSTLERLERFADLGGDVIFVGEAPTLVDALPSSRGKALAARCRQAPFSSGRILDVLEPFREILARQPDGTYADMLLHRVREDGARRYIFVCNVDRRYEHIIHFTITGHWRPTLLETMDGTTRPLPASIEGDTTGITWRFPAHGSLLLQLEPADALGDPPPEPIAEADWEPAGVLADPVPITLSEPNVLLLDHAGYRLDDEPWQPEEEILRIDNILRTRLRYPLKMDAITQPWTQKTPTTHHTVSLRFRIQADVAVAVPLLALEDAEAVTIFLDGMPIPSRRTGWWVDEAIDTVGLPDVGAGTHELLLTLPYGPQTNLEWCYLLGDFGVEVYGRHARIVEPVRELAFGDWTRQRLPFYAGNVTYHCAVGGQDRRMALRVPDFKAPLLTVSVDGVRAGTVAFAPFRLDLGTVLPGHHELALTAYGNRVNAFGPLHNANPHWTWFGPSAWRTGGDDWAYEYQLKPMGVLTAPRVEIAALTEPGADVRLRGAGTTKGATC